MKSKHDNGEIQITSHKVPEVLMWLPWYISEELAGHDLRPHLVYTDPVLNIPPVLLLC